MNEKLQNTKVDWIDEDDAPELTAADFDRGVWHIGNQQISEIEGKAAFKVALKKQEITIELEPDVLAWCETQATHKNFQTLVNAILRDVMQHKISYNFG
jgi:uncharacterized protein (DUF4415 family)